MSIAGGETLPPELWAIQRSYETRLYQSRDTFAKAIAEGRAWTPKHLRSDPGHSVRIGRYVLGGAAGPDAELSSLTEALAAVEPPHNVGWPTKDEYRLHVDESARAVLALLERIPRP